MGEQVTILWKDRMTTLDRDQLKAAWWVYQEVKIPDDYLGSLVRTKDRLMRLHGLSTYDASRYAIAAAKWIPDE